MPNYSFILIAIWLILLAIKPLRKFTLALAPWLLFACCYDWMRWLPNYEVNPIDIEGIYNADCQLFGVVVDGQRITLCEYFNTHNNIVGDLLAGVFYLCWVPVPLGYAIWLYCKKRFAECRRVSWAFLWVNLVGFTLYYVHPAAPPWYALQYGFTPQFGIPGSTAGLARFDALMPFPVFANIYSGNSNVYAAVPSLHSAYVLVAAIYAYLNRDRRCAIAFTIITVGIWWTAVYSSHHYVIDVLLGIAECLVVVGVLEGIRLLRRRA